MAATCLVGLVSITTQGVFTSDMTQNYVSSMFSFILLIKSNADTLRVTEFAWEAAKLAVNYDEPDIVRRVLGIPSVQKPESQKTGQTMIRYQSN